MALLSALFALIVAHAQFLPLRDPLSALGKNSFPALYCTKPDVFPASGSNFPRFEMFPSLLYPSVFFFRSQIYGVDDPRSFLREPPPSFDPVVPFSRESSMIFSPPTSGFNSARGLAFPQWYSFFFSFLAAERTLFSPAFRPAYLFFLRLASGRDRRPF